MSETLNQVLERFKSKVSYREMDKKALDISRAAESGNLSAGDKNYAEWALINDDPMVVVNYVKSFITTLSSKLASAPLRPADDALNERVVSMRLNSLAVDLYKSTLADGYAYLGHGRRDGEPTCDVIDARSIMHNGNDPTLKDATEIVVFEVMPRTRDDDFISTFPVDYVDFDPCEEKVRTSYYYKKNGTVNLDIYTEGITEPEHFEFPELDRLPIVRFYGEKFELSDKRWHYRGLYYQFASIIKATALTATKIQIRNATSDDDNYMAAVDAIANNKAEWRNSGVKTYDHIDTCNNEIKAPVTPIPHDNGFLIQSMELWKSVTADMLGPVVQSSSEAVTREEVLARNEVRDAIANVYLSHLADSLSESYRIISMLLGGSADKVVVQGGFLEEAQRNKFTQETMVIYNMAKEAGLNGQGFVLEILANSSMPLKMKQRLGTLLLQDPFASPVVQQLKNQLAQLTATIQQKDQQIAILKTMAQQRLERQAEWVAAQKEIKRNEIAFKQWQQENKDTQEARMELLRNLLTQGDTIGALAVLDSIKQIDPAIATNPVLNNIGDTELQETRNYVTEDINNVAGNPGNSIGSPQQPQPQQPATRPMAPGAGQPGSPRVVPFPTSGQPQQPLKW